MSISAIYILDDKGNRLVHRDFRGDIDTKCIEVFEKMLFEASDMSSFRPVFIQDEINYIFLKSDPLYLVAVSYCNVNVFTTLSFLRTLVNIIEECIGKLDPEKIVSEVVMIINLIDEAMDFGYPQFTESRSLKSCIKNDSTIFSRTPRSITPTAVRNISWRPEGITYRRNEAFVDVVEKVNLLTNSEGKIITSDITGAFIIKSYLSGMPEIRLGFNDRVLFQGHESTFRRGGRNRKSVDLHDLKFHQCVRLDSFEKERQITFIPPDGKFELLTYRSELDTPPPIWIDAQVKMVSKKLIIYDIQLKSVYAKENVANYIDVRISVPKDCYSPKCRTSTGSVEYLPEEDCIVWKLQNFKGRRDATLYAQLNVPVIAAESYEKTNMKINLKFEVNNLTSSGIKVRYLKVFDSSNYHTHSWIRYVTQHGNYEFRAHVK